MADPIPVAPGVTIPVAALEARQVRASGPGGQNVNKVASRVELLVDVALIEGLDSAARLRLYALAGKRRAADGRLRLVAQELSLIHISEPTRLGMISYAVFCLTKKKK